MAFTDTETFGQRFHLSLVSIERAVGDQCKSTGNCVRSPAPASEIGRGLWTATQTGTKPCFLCRRRTTEKSAVLNLRRAGRAHRAAVNASRRDANEQQPVKPGIAALESTVTSLSIRQFHKHIFAMPGQSN
jgi:hypothetical protein